MSSPIEDLRNQVIKMLEDMDNPEITQGFIDQLK